MTRGLGPKSTKIPATEVSVNGVSPSALADDDQVVLVHNK